MLAEKLLEVLTHEGSVAIATLGADGPHMCNTWNSYVTITPDDRLLIPAGGMNRTQVNVGHDPNVLITLGSKQVQGFRGPGAGFLIRGQAAFLTSGPDYDLMKAKFVWLRAVLAVTIESATQTL